MAASPSSVDLCVSELELQDSKEATLFRIPVQDAAVAHRLVDVLSVHEGVADAHVE